MTSVQDQKVKGQGHKVTECISCNSALTWQWIVASTSNLVGNIILGGSSRSMLSTSVGQINRK